MFIELKKIAIECKDCLVTGAVVITSILTDGQKKTLRSISVNISFFAAGYALCGYAELSQLATMVVAFTTGRYAAILDNHLTTALMNLPTLAKSYWTWKKNG